VVACGWPNKSGKHRLIDRHYKWYHPTLAQCWPKLAVGLLASISLSPLASTLAVPVAKKFITVTFPNDKSLAQLMVYNFDEVNHQSTSRRTRLVAQGVVKIPVNSSIVVILNFDGLEHLSSLEPLGELVEEFSASKLEVEDKHIPHLKKFPKIRRLNLNDALITDKSLPIIGSLKELIDLRLSTTDVTGTGFGALTGLPLRIVNLSGISLKPGTLSKIKSLPEKIIDLNVSKTGCTAIEMPFIGQCIKLTNLDISGNKQIGDSSIKDLSKLTKLKTLQLQDTSVTEKSLPQLAKLPLLKKLVVRSKSFWIKGFGKSPKATLTIYDASASKNVSPDLFDPSH